MDIQRYIIRDNVSIKDALIALNRLSDDTLTLFVIDESDRMIGTLTDGDIRRQLINGIPLDHLVSDAMYKDFSYIEAEKFDIYSIHEYRKKGLSLIPSLDSKRRIVDIYNLRTKKSFLPIDAVLMAGGKGERLRPLTENCPKPLLKVGNKAIIDYNVDRLIEYGFKHISVTVNYLHEQIEKHFETEREGIKIRCIREPSYLGTMGSVIFVKEFKNDTVLIMNSDLFTNIDYEDFYLHFLQHDADMSIAAVPYSISIPYGIFELNGRDIAGVREKPVYNYYANAGIYLVKRKLLDMIPTNTFFNATDFVEQLIQNKKKVIRFPITGYWIDIGKHEDYIKAQDLVKHL